MSPLHPLPRLRSQRGVSIITAIFLIVVLAGLSTAIVTVSTTQQTSSALDLLGSRAYEAARSGAEYGMFRVQQAGEPCNFTRSFNPAAPTLAPFTVTVRCIGTAVVLNPSKTVEQRIISATACNQPSGGVCPNPTPTSTDYVQRVVSVQIFR